VAKFHKVLNESLVSKHTLPQQQVLQMQECKRVLNNMRCTWQSCMLISNRQC
jgi:hypothetical protein